MIAQQKADSVSEALGMLQVQQEAKRAVASMLERAGMSDRIKSVMGMLRRYESLFRLPSRIMQETECGEFEAVSCFNHRCSSRHTQCVWQSCP